MASQPSEGSLLKFNVRLAISPEGSDAPNGIGSTYVFSLKEGDEVKLTRSYGDFKIADEHKEKVYIGGGAGMAPIRSHISYLFSEAQTKSKVNYFYGARSQMEMFYNDEFKKLAEEHEHFHYTVRYRMLNPMHLGQGPRGLFTTSLKESF